MKKYLLILLTSLIPIFTYGQMQKMHVKGEPKKIKNEIVGKKDANGEYCAAIKVISNMEGFKYESYNGVVEVKDNPGEDVVYLSPNERVLKIYNTGYKPKKIILSEYGIQLKQKRIWKINISGSAKKIPINIITHPEDALIYFDGHNIGANKTHRVPVGQHQIRLEKKGYRTFKDTIKISGNNTLFEYTLEEIKPVKVTIKSEPAEAEIYLENVNIGRTDRQVFRYPDDYKLSLRKNKYEPIDTVINVKEEGNNTFFYELRKNTATLKINTNPDESQIYLNNSKIQGKRKEVAPGKYQIEVRGKDHYSKDTTIIVHKGEQKTFNFDLKEKTGELQIVVQPINAKVVLERENQIIDSWTGSKYISGLTVGEYLLKCNLSNYKQINRQIYINNNQVDSVNITLNKAEEAPKKSDYKPNQNKQAQDNQNDEIDLFSQNKLRLGGGVSYFFSEAGEYFYRQGNIELETNVLFLDLGARYLRRWNEQSNGKYLVDFVNFYTHYSVDVRDNISLLTGVEAERCIRFAVDTEEGWDDFSVENFDINFSIPLGADIMFTSNLGIRALYRFNFHDFFQAYQYKENSLGLILFVEL